MKNKKYNITVLIILIFFALSFIMFYSSNKISNSSSLNGTYRSKSSNFISITFDEKEGMYYYYNPLSDDKINSNLVTKGVYHKNGNGSYTIEESAPITNQTVFYDDNSLIIYMEDKIYTFYKINDIPSIVIESAP